MSEPEKTRRQYNILVFGMERKGLPIPTEPISTQNYSIHFEKYGTTRRFNEYDGVVIYQGIFENFELIEPAYSENYMEHMYDTDELDKRKKEARILLGQGGFICFLLTENFIDRYKGRDYTSTDLTKCHLNYSNLYRDNFQNRMAHVTPIQDEFKRFLDLHGAACSHFKYHNSSLDLREIAKVNNQPVGILINRLEYFLPTLVPAARSQVIIEYFTLLVDAITSVHNKLHQELPDWIATFKFDEENSLQKERSELQKNIHRIDRKLQDLTLYKAILAHTDYELVADVKNIFESGFDIKVDAIDELREDLKLLDKDGKVICVCEIKGINRGISREYINQTDSHRERSGYDNQFPALLIANTNIKSARSIQEKDQEIAVEQIAHAAKMNVLIMRSIDLLALLRLVFSGKLSHDQAKTFMFTNAGWLRVQNDDVKILTGT